MPYITTQCLSLAIARIGKRIESELQSRNIETNEDDDPLKEACDDLKHLANVLHDAIEDEKLNERKTIQ
jgi:hypothetical protein